MNSRALIFIIVAFIVGAVAPLLGLLFAAFALGSWYSQSGQQKLCDPELLEEIREIERQEHKRINQRSNK